MSRDSLGEPVARGRTADIYAWQDGQVLKLFQTGFDRASIENEARITRTVRTSGLPVPLAGEIVEVNGRVGVIYERVDGPTMGKALTADPDLLEPYAKSLAELHAQMHSVLLAGELTTLQSKLEWKIQHAAALSEAARRGALEDLAAMPGGAELCHGDFHPENVLMTDRGAVIIDWMDASRGNALADVARTSIILLGEAQRNERSPALAEFIGEFHDAYKDEYFRLRPQGWEEYERWLPIVAAARLSEGISEVEEWLLRRAQLF